MFSRRLAPLPPSGPRPSRVGTPSAAVKLPSDPARVYIPAEGQAEIAPARLREVQEALGARRGREGGAGDAAGHHRVRARHRRLRGDSP